MTCSNTPSSRPDRQATDGEPARMSRRAALRAAGGAVGGAVGAPALAWLGSATAAVATPSCEGGQGQRNQR